MIYLGMTFRGIRKDYATVLRGRKRPTWAAVERNIMEVSGFAGGHLSETKTKPRIITVPILIKGHNFSNLQKLKEDLASWLITDKPEPLIFDDEIDRVYYAIVDGSLDLDEIVRWGKGEITFLCPNPYKYGIEETTQLINDPNSDDANPTVINVGTVPTQPIFRAQILKDTTYLAIMNQDEYIAVGQPADPESVVVERHTKLINDAMGSTTGWGQTDTITDGYVRGEIEADGIRFFPRNFGTAVAPLRWQGPALKKSIPGGPVKNFQMNALIRNENIGYETGMVEVYLLNAANEQIARIHIADSWEGIANINGRVQLGTPGKDARFVWITNAPNKNPDWANFEGIMTLQREDNVWRLYFAISKDGKRIHEITKIYTDRDGIATDDIAQVQIAFRKWPNTVHTRMSIYHLNFWEINDVDEPQIPIIAQAGDEVIIDHIKQNITINGESLMEYKDLASSFFSIPPGESQLLSYPPDVAKVDITKDVTYL